ncbi:homoserine kinase [Macrococcoides caseolyticum]|uniref:homoserine kinase n=1 Tax=Macrococcoides caseolyticum TaxID=69966 RepID=UPI001F3B236D|nr:homoserine kinase [Macrococcus caseolyticus]MCE4957186.1 homoserine kinase [Macrococcus caseolyticus]
MLYIKVPASTSNLGPGFDSIGMAVNLYLELEVCEHDVWEIQHFGEMLAELVNDEQHYIRKYCQYFIDKFNLPEKYFSVVMHSDIPLARGLGSSGSALIASLEIINYFYELNLSKHEKVRLLSEIEGHPDNVAPSILGGVVVGYYNPQKNITNALQVPVIEWPIMVVIPDYELKTSEARAVLPKEMPYNTAVEAGAIGNMLTAALYSKDYALAGQMMQQDIYHEPYRKHLVPHYDIVNNVISGQCFSFLSGAGPSIFVICHPDHFNDNFKALNLLQNCEIKHIQIDVNGVIAYEK